MIPDSHAKSFLSKSYVNAIVTQAGYVCSFSEPDYGIDALISEVQFLPNGKYMSTGYHFNIQIKASHDFKKKDGEVVYSIDADAYDRLIYHDGGLIVLVLFCLPKEPADRIALSEDSLELRNCCYWYRVTDKDKKTLHIPRLQIFNPAACHKLMDCARTRAWTK